MIGDFQNELFPMDDTGCDEQIAKLVCLNAGQCAERLGIGRSKWMEMNRTGQCPSPCMRNGRTLWGSYELEMWVMHHTPNRNAWGKIWAGIRAASVRRYDRYSKN